jgi:pimeloyl-ACP methyl ester carboxylesterase
MKINPRKTFRIVWFSIVAIFSLWMWSTFQARGLPANTFRDDDWVTVEESDDKITFRSTSDINRSEIIFFQGGLTDPEAYAPLCRNIAISGFNCHLVKMDWRLPRYDYKKVKDLFDLSDGDYIIGGHSQGAVMAAQFVYENPGVMKGLFLMGTSHPRDIDLSKMTIPTIKLYADRDGLASVSEVMQNQDKLPRNTKLVLIKGGNHSQFGYLGNLLTDDSPRISLIEQQDSTLKFLITHFNEIELEYE